MMELTGGFSSCPQPFAHEKTVITLVKVSLRRYNRVAALGQKIP